MKSILTLITFLFVFISCKPSGKETVTTEDPTIITSSDTSAIVPQPDSLTLDPETHETALQSDPPPTTAITPKDCDPNFTLVGKPKAGQQVYFVSGFNPGEFKCWEHLENHSNALCGDRPCTIYYLDNAKVKLTTAGPHYISEADLKQYGVGVFIHNGKFWEINGSRKWQRTGKGFDYYNTNNHLGG